MTALQLVNQWHRQRRIDDPRLYELMVRRLTIKPVSPHALDITGISAARLSELVTSGAIGQVRGVGVYRLRQLRQLVRPHHRELYVDREQLMRLSERVGRV